MMYLQVGTTVVAATTAMVTATEAAATEEEVSHGRDAGNKRHNPWHAQVIVGNTTVLYLNIPWHLFSYPFW